MKKYICYSGIVFSSDGDIHEIAATRLPSLYNVNPQECIFIRSSADLLGHTKDFIANLIELRPRSDGNYALPE